MNADSTGFERIFRATNHPARLADTGASIFPAVRLQLIVRRIQLPFRP